jgi:hypothetical protein
LQFDAAAQRGDDVVQTLQLLSFAVFYRTVRERMSSQ